jgi:nitrate reductase NapE
MSAWQESPLGAMQTLRKESQSRGGGIHLGDDAAKKAERRAFVFLVVFLGPILAIAIVGGYGFLVWMTQLVTGPPGA